VQPGGQLIDGKYQLVEIAGEGGMATVYKAVQKGAAGFQRTVAIKHIKPEYRALKNYVDMFIEEARVGSELAHPNIVQVHDFVAQEGSYYLVMEWVEGIDLGHFIRLHKEQGIQVDWPLAVAIGIATLRGLGAAHERRAPSGELAPVIHRDVTPHNILLGVNGVVKLTDFGIAKVFASRQLTRAWGIVGTADYLSPEQALGKPATKRSDLYSLGVVLYRMLTGWVPFQGNSTAELLHMHV
jgi:serine/threonine-protein kinase